MMEVNFLLMFLLIVGVNSQNESSTSAHRHMIFRDPYLHSQEDESSSENVVPYITNGEDAEIYQFKGHVTLAKGHYFSFKYRYTPFCGGALIDDWHVITAAHCIDKALDSFYIIGGSISMNTDYNVIYSAPLSIKIHEHYDHTFFKNDIAVIHLASPLPGFSETAPRVVVPVTLGSDLTPSGPDFIAVGFGQTRTNQQIRWMNYNRLHFARLEVVDRAICNSDPSQLCTKSVVEGSNVCYGDFGGGLYRNQSQSRFSEIVGLASYRYGGIACDDKTSDNRIVFTNVAYFANWINDTKWNMPL